MQSLSAALGVSPVVVRTMVNRDITDVNLAKKFLHPSEADFFDTAMFKDIERAIELVSAAISNQKKIAIYGDYDVDGVMSTTILYKGLKPFVSALTYYIPHREKEGYGLNKAAIKTLAESGVNLLLACDNGITAVEEVAYAHELGMQVVILDHHEPIVKGTQEVLPDADAIVNQKQTHCAYPFKHLCAAGISYKFINHLYLKLDKPLAPTLKEELLVFAGIATLCDVVDLLEENRLIVHLAINILREQIDNIGLKNIAKLKNLTQLDEENIGFVIGPCINAAGRLENAMMAVDLFTAEDEATAKKIATDLVELNERRKAITKEAMDIILAEMDNAQVDNVIVAYNPAIHEAVAGIVAGRLKEKFHRPTVVLTKGESYVKGSARSIESYDIYEGLAAFRHLYHKFGGHQMAAGLSLEEENVPILRKGLNDAFNASLEEIINIDMQVSLTELTYLLAKELDVLKPFGKANPAPLFGTKSVKVLSVKLLPDKNTIIFTFETEREKGIKGIYFGGTDKFTQMILSHYDDYVAEKIFAGIIRNIEIKMDILYYLDINVYNGLTSVQVRLRDFRITPK